VIETIRFPVLGMTCASCASRITRALRKVDGVERVEVDLRRETAAVRRDVGLVSNAALQAAVAAAGYGANLEAAVVVPTVDRPGMAARLLALIRS
jgi:Cu+-exporting ATPase